jgi:hypothetical protein
MLETEVAIDSMLAAILLKISLISGEISDTASRVNACEGGLSLLTCDLGCNAYSFLAVNHECWGNNRNINLKHLFATE